MNIKNNKQGEKKQGRACEGGENIGVVSHTKNWNKRAKKNNKRKEQFTKLLDHQESNPDSGNIFYKF